MHAFHLRHHPGLRLDAPPGRTVSFVLWVIIIFLALLCLSARRATASVPVPGPVAPVAGDCDGDGRVSVAEVQRAVNMYLGLEPSSCGVDADGDGKVSAEEAQRVLDAYRSARETGPAARGLPVPAGGPVTPRP